MKKIILLLPLALLLITGAKAQSVGPATLNATGGTSTIGTTVFEWSVGEMTMVSTFTSANIIVTQGVLQPSEAMVSVPETKMTKSLNVFPNPATDLVNLQYRSTGDGTLQCRLLDLNGKEISSQKLMVVNGQANGQVDVRSLAAATYVLEVVVIPENGAQETMSYKIQKLK